MSAFLSQDEIASFTREDRPKQQIEVLQKRGLLMHVNAKGLPVVLRSKYEQNAREEYEPDPIDAVTEALCSLDASELFKRSRTWGQVCGVYFLMIGMEVVYVGQSIDVHKRISEHKDKEFTHVSWISCPLEYLNQVEAHYIKKFRPKLNKAGL